ncbi:hypothetical protein GCK32_002789 [Trichostrongylus colubriformis]|uniref:Uncharacterized protein n=1 Tax=Trichostrongylus colubriformis TaxID=6319 RepID=A0AAN8IC48_TRICO
MSCIPTDSFDQGFPQTKHDGSRITISSRILFVRCGRLNAKKSVRNRMVEWIIETVAITISLTCASLIRCAQRAENTTAVSERTRSARRSRREVPAARPRVENRHTAAKTARSSAAPASAMKTKTTTGDDGGYEICPDLNSAQLRKIAASA